MSKRPGLFRTSPPSSVPPPFLPVSSAILNFSPATYVFFAQYRLLVDEATRFPAALQDVLTFYHYLLRLGIEPGNIVVSGDSAGANLVIGLLRHLEKSQGAAASLPLPSGVMLWSPWVRVTQQAGAEFESHKNAANDCISAPILQWGAEAYFPRLPQPSTDELAYISPIGDPFHTGVPIFIHGGTAEGLYDTISEFAGKMGRVDGNRVRFHSTDFTTHNLIMAHDGWESEIEAVIKDAYRFFLL
ncbi:Alpha/Beta hydrolase protein [Nemania sp. NC0429]|nr:Alpha/Beta hydrolase protein [Nemania sp. NC0429]